MKQIPFKLSPTGKYRLWWKSGGGAWQPDPDYGWVMGFNRVREGYIEGIRVYDPDWQFKVRTVEDGEPDG